MREPTRRNTAGKPLPLCREWARDVVGTEVPTVEDCPAAGEQA